MNPVPERNLGEQPILRVMARHGVTAHDVVSASPEPMTHKMVARAGKGRWLTPHARIKVRNALNRAVNGTYGLEELFTYH